MSELESQRVFSYLFHTFPNLQTNVCHEITDPLCEKETPECPVVQCDKLPSSNTSNYKPLRRPSETLPRTTQRRAFPGHFFHPHPSSSCVCVCVPHASLTPHHQPLRFRPFSYNASLSSVCHQESKFLLCLTIGYDVMGKGGVV